MKNRLLRNLQPSNPPTPPRPKRLPKDRSGWTFDGYFRTFWRRTLGGKSPRKGPLKKWGPTMTNQRFTSLKRSIVLKQGPFLRFMRGVHVEIFFRGKWAGFHPSKENVEYHGCLNSMNFPTFWHTPGRDVYTTCSMKVNDVFKLKVGHFWTSDSSSEIDC